jgi:hypothetical protein
VQIWRVAIEEFKGSPVAGVGADNFIFQYDRLRVSESYKPQQAHSIELQVLGETGLVGGVLFFGGILLALGAWLWPRCTAGWRQARATWPGGRGRAGVQTDRPPIDGPPARSGASNRWCNPRWGDDPTAYGWEMALLAGTAYWLIHASVDWIWQMAGVTIPALLFLAAGVAGVDARAGVLWPRLRHWTSLGGAPAVAREVPPEVIAAPPAGGSQVVSSEPLDGFADLPGGPRGEAPTATTIPAALASSPGRVVRVAQPMERAPVERGARTREASPRESLLSHVFRALIVALAAVTLVVTGLPYLSMQYQDSALALAGTDGLRAAKRAAAARYLLPTDPGPYLTQAEIYDKAALRTLDTGGPQAAGAMLDDLALAVGSYDKALALESADWTIHYHAGVTMLNIMLARGYLEGWPTLRNGDPRPAGLAGIGDWSSLAASGGEPASPGLTPGSLAQDEVSRAEATEYRKMSAGQLAKRTLDFLQAAKERNPLASQVDRAIETTNKIMPQGGS